MKTLVVLLALVSIALGAPTLQEDGIEHSHHVPGWHLQTHPGIPATVKREKKSTSELTTGTVLHTGIPNTEIHSDTSTPTFMGRTIASKKPLIVKKKFGYRLYRDSEEEKAHADSHESCGRQVKVKLCDEDGKFREMLRSSAHEISNVHSSTDDMKLSIKMAKEAVENLQRDLLKMESRNAAMKMAHASESDSDLHEDIEVARQALEHIHSNFGDLETMSLHATASRDSEALHDVHITMAKSEEERMAQWKEAMENIQRNVDIARNIEDSFKNANHQDSLLHLDHDSVPINNEHQLEDIATHVISNDEHHMRGAEVTHLDIRENEHSEHDLTDKATNEHVASNLAREEHHMEDDMNPSASEAIEMKAIDILNHHTLRSENHEHHEHEKSAEAKLETHETGIQNIETHATTPVASSSIIQHQPSLSIKEAEEHTATKLEDKTTLPKSSENIDDTHKTILPKSLENIDDTHKTTLPKSSENVDDTHKIILPKSSENLNDSHKTTSIDSVTTLTPGTVNEHQRNTEQELHDRLEHQDQHENPSVKIENLTDLQAKSVKHIEDDHKEIINEDINLNAEIAKAAEKIWPDLENHHSETFETKQKDAASHIESEEKDKQDNFAKSVQEINVHQINNEPEQFDDFLRAATLQENNKIHKIDYNESHPDHVPALNGMKAAEHHSHQHLPSMKAVENHLQFQQHIPASKTAEHHHHLHHHMATTKFAETPLQHHIMSMNSAENHMHHLETVPANGHWAQTHLTSKEATDEFHRKDFDGLEHVRNLHLAEHRHAPNKMEFTHDYEMSQHGHQYAHAHAPELHQHKAHDMNGMSHAGFPSKFHPSMRDAMEGFGSEHMYRWAPTHEYRNAYGGSMSGSVGSSGGAVGVFPNANTGGCGIPLLLSCSPSVVSGSLAKAHPSGQGSYSGSSYRSEDEFGFHNKRDIKKTKEMRSTTVLRTPTIVKHKTGTMLENQL